MRFESMKRTNETNCSKIKISEFKLARAVSMWQATRFMHAKRTNRLKSFNYVLWDSGRASWDPQKAFWSSHRSRHTLQFELSSCRIYANIHSMHRSRSDILGYINSSTYQLAVISNDSPSMDMAHAPSQRLNHFSGYHFLFLEHTDSGSIRPLGPYFTTSSILGIQHWFRLKLPLALRIFVNKTRTR